MLTKKERRKILLEWNSTRADYPDDKTIHQLFEEQVKRTPDNVAIVYEDQQLSYRALNQRANQLARLIRDKYKKQNKENLKPDNLIGLCVDRSLEMIISILAILKAGAAYVPLDPSYPKNRLEYMIEDSHEGLIITQKDVVARDEFLDKLHHDELIVINSEKVKTELDRQSVKDLAACSSSNDLAYVIYTSGSTGKPKGVMIEHHSVLNLVSTQKIFFNCDEKTRFLQFSSISFDAMVFETFISLLIGGALFVVSNDVRQDVNKLANYIEDERIDLATLPPALLSVFPELPLVSLKTLIVAGEVCKQNTMDFWSRKRCFINAYGPTESTVCVSMHKYSKGDLVTNIGKPNLNIQVYILDDHLNPCSIEMPGELYIGGAGLARGYLNQEDLTNESFIKNPFAKELGLSEVDRIYKTGDLARWLFDGSVEFLGRSDFQVKLRGYRIELGEIERVLESHPEVMQAVVVLKGEDVENYLDKKLVAYCQVNDKGLAETDLQEEEFVNQWKSVYKDVYQKKEARVNTFDITGWNDSFTGKAIPYVEMREWVSSTVSCILEYNPRNVLEVGCGSGLLLYSLAPRCKTYVGVDFSEHVVSKLNASFDKLNIKNAAASVGHADRISHLRLELTSEVDMIVINSVSQHFPNQIYLDRVIKQAIKRVRVGHVFLGDVRDYRLLDIFHFAIQCYQAKEKNEQLDWNKLVILSGRHARQERELLISPEYFLKLRRQYSSVKYVEILPKRGRFLNEMNRFRYDVVLHINGKIEKNSDLNWIDWNHDLELESLLTKSKKMLAVHHYPNKRVWFDSNLFKAVTRGEDILIYQAELHCQLRSIYSLEELYEISEKHGYLLKAYLNIDGVDAAAYYDLVFYCDTVKINNFERVYKEGELKVFTNNPLADSLQQVYNFDEINGFLKKNLPDYMIPSIFVKLNVMPLTESGKINREGLPEPDVSLASEDFVEPRNKIERQLASIWCDLLKVSRVGINDNFFHLGGHSLLVTQLVARLHAKLNFDTSIKTIFDYPKLEDLAVFIEKKKLGKKGEAYSSINPVRRFPKGNLLSFSQEYLWFLDRLEGASKYYTIPIVLNLIGNLDVKALEFSINQLIKRHESFRTVFSENKKGVGVQEIFPQLELKLIVKKITGKALREAINREVHSSFDLLRGPLVRAQLFKLKNEQYVLIFNCHHIISDGWSIDIIFKELSELYQSQLEKRSPKLESLPIQYVDFSAWQRREFEKPAFQQKLKFWVRYLADYADLQLPVDMRRPGRFSYRGADYHFNLDKDLSVKLIEYAKKNNTTLYVILLMAFNLLLSRCSNQEDIVIGTPTANRNHHDVKGLVGFFVNTVVLRNRVQGDKTVKQLLNQISSSVLDAFENQEVPFEKVVKELKVVRDPSRNPIFQVMFSLQSFGINVTGESALQFPAVRVTPYTDVNYDVAKFDLSLFMEESSFGLTACFNYSTDLFYRESIERLARYFERLLQSIVHDGSQKIKELRLLTDKGRRQIFQEWNDTRVDYPFDKTVFQLFEQQVNKTPNEMAVFYENQKLTYQALNQKANQLARFIRLKYKKQNGKELKPDSLIGLCIKRSLEMIISILAILKAGAAYVPLDSEYPNERLEYMIQDSHEGMIITQKEIVAYDEFLTKLYRDDLLIIDSNEVKIEVDKQENSNLGALSGPNNLAYVIYTSGSTGRPKGVMIEHHNVLNHVSAQKKFLACDKRTRSLQFSSISFDVMVSETFVSLVSGGALFIVSDDARKDVNKLVNYIDINKINLAILPPALLPVLPELSLPSLKTLIIAGEVCKQRAMDFWSRGRRFINAYGPTESTVFASMHEYLKGDSITNIGKPYSNTQLYVLDSFLNPCPIGTLGELYIGGEGLARGYLNQEELTKERFILNPFAKEVGLPESDKIYKTGDLVRWLPNGDIDFLDRVDFQVKIRGFRVELSEIENVLIKHKSISQVCVKMHEEEMEKYLVAYYVVVGEAKVSIDVLRDYLSKSLPNYMVPTVFIKLDAMPLTVNGKINRKVLPEPDVQLMGEKYIAPRNKAEQSLASIWVELLKINQIGIHDSFFQLGGSSLLLMRLAAKIKKNFRVDLPISKLYVANTLEKQAQLLEIEQSRLPVYKSLVAYQTLGSSLPLFLVHGGRCGAECYYEFSQLLDKEQNFYGIESYNLYHLDKAITHLSVLAKRYICSIKKIDPHGPYFLGGWSLGGIIAYEMAQQLTVAGDKVAGLYLIDSIALTPESWRQMHQFYDEEDILSELKAFSNTPADLARLIQLRSIETHMVENYRVLASFEFPVILMEALELDQLNKKVSHLIKGIHKGWSKITKQLTVHSFNADHYSIMRGKHLRRLVKLIQSDISHKK